MDANTRRIGGGYRRPVQAAALVVMLVAPMATASATPIRWNQMRGGPHGNVPRSHLALQVSPSSTTSVSGGWARFLAGGESTWASQPSPRYTAGVRNAVVQLINGDPAVAASSPLIEYFVWRRNLDPTRFDSYHPFIGPRLPQEFIPPVPQVIPPVVPPVDPPLTPPVPSVVPPQVPEPSTLLVLVIGAAGACLVQRTRLGRISRG